MSEIRRHVVLRMADGIQLAATLYVPAHGRPVPALLEALPYRKDDILHRDEYERLRDEFDFAVCRVDLRGTGSSEGIATDEYPESELADLTEVIEWLAAQSWCNGAVGMFGWSYSGFNALLVAAEQPPALKAIVPVYSSDDRYTDDVHYMGGSLRLLDLVDYPLYMVAKNTLPPVPDLVGAGWRQAWRDRLDKTEPWLLQWLVNQRRDPYWQLGSLRPHYDRVRCPTMLVGGWADGYRNNSFRTIRELAAAGTPYRLLLGPWSHMGADRSLPGPWLDFTAEMARWFDRWLRADDNGIDPEPPVTIFMRRSTRPEPDLAELNGEWISEDDLGLNRVRPHRLVLGTDVVEYVVLPAVGTAAWNSCAGSLPWGQPTDQRYDDAASLCSDWSAAADELADARTDDGELALLGCAVLRLRIAADRPTASVSAKLNDVFPDGTSALITRGFLNLTHRHGHDGAPAPLVPAEFVDVEIELEATAWTLDPGHTLRLSIAGTDWPNTVAPPRPVILTIDRAASTIELPVLHGSSPHPAPRLPHVRPNELADGAGIAWRIERDVLARTTSCVVDHGSTWMSPAGRPVSDHYAGRVTIDERDWSQSVDATARFEVDLGEAQVAAESRLTMRITDTTLQVEIVARTFDGEQMFSDQIWQRDIPRDLA